jgi:hypothetical protein
MASMTSSILTCMDFCFCESRLSDLIPLTFQKTKPEDARGLVQGVQTPILRQHHSTNRPPGGVQWRCRPLGGTVSSCRSPLLHPDLRHLLRLAVGARRKHRGPQPGHKKTLSKKSNKRREELFEPAVVTTAQVVSHALPTEASRDYRTEEEIQALLPWVSSLWQTSSAFKMTLLIVGHGHCCILSIPPHDGY